MTGGEVEAAVLAVESRRREAGKGLRGMRREACLMDLMMGLIACAECWRVAAIVRGAREKQCGLQNQRKRRENGTRTVRRGRK